MCAGGSPPAPPSPKTPSASELANQQTGNVLTQFLNPQTGAFGQGSLRKARQAGLSDFQITQLLPGSGVSSLGEVAAAELSKGTTRQVSPGPILSPQQQFEKQMMDMEARNNRNRQQDIARAEAMTAQQMAIQQKQFDQSMAAQKAALDAQLRSQAELQRRSEEAALRSQVPQLTANSSNARRVRSRETGREAARRAAMGTSQLRVPLSIGSSAGSSGSPVKLNIGS